MIESHVVNFELSRRLHELGVKKESIFYWRDNDGFQDNESDFSLVQGEKSAECAIWFCSAYTASELLEMLPSILPGNRQSYFLEIRKYDRP